MKVDVINLIGVAIVASIAYKMGKVDGYNKHADKCKDLILNQLLDKEKDEES